MFVIFSQKEIKNKERTVKKRSYVVIYQYDDTVSYTRLYSYTKRNFLTVNDNCKRYRQDNNTRAYQLNIIILITKRIYKIINLIEFKKRIDAFVYEKILVHIEYLFIQSCS